MTRDAFRQLFGIWLFITFVLVGAFFLDSMDGANVLAQSYVVVVLVFNIVVILFGILVVRSA